MIELLLALGGFGLLAGLALLVMLVPPMMLGWGAVALTLGGFLFGVPTGFYYHVVLRRELLRVGPLPRGWYWHPNRYHVALSDDALRRVQPWFFLGGFGFLLVVVGFVIAFVVVVTSAR